MTVRRTRSEWPRKAPAESEEEVTGPEHYAAAERLLRESEGKEPEAGRECIWTAQVHATLANCAALIDAANARAAVTRVDDEWCVTGEYESPS